MRYVKAIVGFVIGGLVIVAILMAVDVYLAGNTYRGTPPLGNFIFGTVIFSPFVLCGSLGFALGLRLFGTTSRITQASLVGAAFALLLLGINRSMGFNPFDYPMLIDGALVFILAIPSALLPRVLIKSNVEARAGYRER